MRRIGSLLAVLCTSCLLAESSLALTVDEVIKLKQAGVADSTIEHLIKRAGDARAAGVWKQDGWIVQSTPNRETSVEYDPAYYGYPMFVGPRALVGRRWR